MSNLLINLFTINDIPNRDFRFTEYSIYWQSGKKNLITGLLVDCILKKPTKKQKTKNYLSKKKPDFSKNSENIF